LDWTADHPPGIQHSPISIEKEAVNRDIELSWFFVLSLLSLFAL
jgi:hypothetical protein